MAVPMISILLRTRDEIILKNYQQVHTEAEQRFYIQSLNAMVNDYIEKNQTEEVYEYFMEYMRDYKSFSGHPDVSAMAFTIGYYAPFAEKLLTIAKTFDLPTTIYHQSVSTLHAHFDELDGKLHKLGITDLNSIRAKALINHYNKMIYTYDDVNEFKKPEIKKFLARIVAKRTLTSAGAKIPTDSKYYALITARL